MTKELAIDDGAGSDVGAGDTGTGATTVERVLQASVRASGRRDATDGRGKSAGVAPGSDGAGPLLITASLGTEDRAGDVIRADGWVLDGYLRNPVFLWAHRRSEAPIGRARRVWVDGDALHALVEFAPTERGQTVRRLYASGHLRGISVGFRPLATRRRRASDGRLGLEFVRQELLEISAAPIPMHPDALAKSVPRVEGSRVDAAPQTADAVTNLQHGRTSPALNDAIGVMATPTDTGGEDMTVEKYIGEGGVPGNAAEGLVEADAGAKADAGSASPIPSTADWESLRKEVAGIAQFVRERSEPLAEEQSRLQAVLDDVVATQRRSQRAAIASKSLPGAGAGGGASVRRVVDAGPYAGCDVLDLALARSLQRAATHSHGEDATRDWDVRLKAALDSVTAGSGDELVPTGYASQLWRDVRQQTRVASLFSEIDMPTNPFTVPLELGDVSWYPGSENTATTQSTPATSRQTLTAHELLAEVPWSLTLEEDAVVAMLPELRRTLIESAASVLDDVLLNADVTSANNINADTGTVSKSVANEAHWRLGFDGLLHLPLVDNTAQGLNADGKLGAGTFLQLLAKLGKYGIGGDTVFVCDTSTYINALGLEQVATVDKLGSRATLLTGQLGSIFGAPLVVSGQLKRADKSGKVTSGGNASERGRVLAVSRGQWRIGYRRRLLIETQRDIQKRQHTMVVSMRLAFAERTGNRTTATHTALAYNIEL